MSAPDDSTEPPLPIRPMKANGGEAPYVPAPPKPALPKLPAPPEQHPAPAQGGSRHVLKVVIGLAVLGGALYEGIPWVQRTLSTVSTDDAFVNGHVTFVAPRVTGQVSRVLVDDNNRVHKGDLLVQLDKEPFQVQVDIAQAAVSVAQADLVSAQAQVRGQEGLARSLRYNLQHSIEDVQNQVAVLRSKVATVKSKKASVAKAQADYDRVAPLVSSGAASKQEFDACTEALSVAKAQLDEALQGAYQVRAGLGLVPQPADENDLIQVPDDLDQTNSTVKEAQAKLIQVASQLGVVGTFDSTPKQMVENFYKRDPEGNIDRIYSQLLKDAPDVKRAEAKLGEAQRNLEQAQLNLRYCDIATEIDGVVTRRNVNTGNHVVSGQGLMAIRSLAEIWVDANFKETQLTELRIGQKVELDVDMYGKSQHFEGRITGFTMGTGSTLALLPAENATGNYVKVVQRVPVRIDILNYDPEKTPLIVGASVEPHVLIREPASGPNAGQVLQPYQPTTMAAQDTHP